MGDNFHIETVPFSFLFIFYYIFFRLSMKKRQSLIKRLHECQKQNRIFGKVAQIYGDVLWVSKVCSAQKQKHLQNEPSHSGKPKSVVRRLVTEYAHPEESAGCPEKPEHQVQCTFSDPPLSPNGKELVQSKEKKAKCAEDALGCQQNREDAFHISARTRRRSVPRLPFR